MGAILEIDGEGSFLLWDQVGALSRGRRSAAMAPETQTWRRAGLGENAESSSGCMCGPGLGSGWRNVEDALTETEHSRRRGVLTTAEHSSRASGALRALWASIGPLDGLGTCRESTASAEVPAHARLSQGLHGHLTHAAPHGGLRHRRPSSRRGSSRAVKLRVCPRS